MPGWFDLYDWPIEVGATDDKVNKLKGVDAIQTAVDRLRSQGIDKIVVGGFSQGGAIALLSAYHPHSRANVSGCVALSAWLTLTDDVVAGMDDTKKTVPSFWAHGTYDDKVLFEHQHFGVTKLTEAGVKSIETRQYPMGHESIPKEVTEMAEFLDRIFFGKDEDKSDL
jgi:lysophospholipase II